MHLPIDPCQIAVDAKGGVATAGRHDLALQQVRSTLPASRASRKFVLLPAQSTLARFISALLVGGVSITWPKTARSVARIKLANEVGGDQRHHQRLTAIIAGNLTRRVAMVGPLHSAARKLAAKIPS